MLLEGLFLPLTTPFYGDGRVYLRKLEHNAERYSRTQAAGLAVLTANGEVARLNDAERREVLTVAAAATAEATVLLADVSHGAVRETLRLAEAAAAAMYDVVLVRVPAAPLAEQRLYLQAVADGSALPVVLSEDDVELPIEAMLELAPHPGVIGCVTRRSGARVRHLLAGTVAVKREVAVTPVFAAVTGRMLREKAVAVTGNNFVAAETLTGGVVLASPLPVVVTTPAMRTRVRTVGFQVLAGATEGSLEALRAGARGTMQPFAVCAPQACYEVLQAWKDEDEPLADEKYARVLAGARRIEGELRIGGIKAACDLTGYFGGGARLAGTPVRGEDLAEIERLMRGMRS